MKTDFGWALRTMNLGYRVTRKSWKSPATFIELQFPDRHNHTTHRYIAFNNTFTIEAELGDIEPTMTTWTPTQLDLLAEDWQLSSVDPEYDRAQPWIGYAPWKDSDYCEEMSNV